MEDEVRRVAEQHWVPAELPATGRIMLMRGHGKLVFVTIRDRSGSIQLFLSQGELGEDALKGLVYLDDEQVTDVLRRKRSLNSNLRVENPSSVLAEGLSRGSQFLYVVVEEAPNQEVIS